jgi:hypothetical protein
MKHRSGEGSWVVGLLLRATLMPARIAVADESGRRYDSNGRFQGAYRVSGTSTIGSMMKLVPLTVASDRNGHGYRRVRPGLSGRKDEVCGLPTVRRTLQGYQSLRVVV